MVTEPSDPHMSEGLADDRHKRLEKEALLLSAEYPDLKIDCILSSGMIKDKIIQTADVRNADLIVMGTHGAGSWRDVIIGTNTADVIQSSDIPVIAVPGSYKNFRFSKIAFATTFAEYDFQTLFRTTELFKSYSSEIFVVHVDSKSEGDSLLKQKLEFAGMVKSGITYDNIRFETINDSHTETALLNFIKSNNIDIVVTSARKRNIFEKFTDRSLSRQMAFHTSVPLLVYHSENKTSYPFF